MYSEVVKKSRPFGVAAVRRPGPFGIGVAIPTSTWGTRGGTVESTLSQHFQTIAGTQLRINICVRFTLSERWADR